MKTTLLLFSSLLLICCFANAQTNYNYYYGNLHAHTSYSDGNQDSASSLITKPIQAFNYAKNSQHIDFYGVSEHNHASAGMKSKYAFHQGVADANAATIDGSFVALYGMEWGVISGGGHVMIYGIDSLFGWDSNLFDVYTPQSDYTTLWKKIIARPNSFAYLCHPSSSDYGNILNTAVNINADSAIIGMAGRSGPAFSTNTSYTNPSTSDYISQYNMALARGYHVGVGLDHDTHNSVFGRSQNGRLVVLAESLTKAHIMDAMKKMRFYCSDDWNVKVDFQIKNQPMGSIITQSGVPTLSISVSDADVAESVASIKIYHGITGSGTSPTLLTTATSTANFVYTHSTVANNTKHYYYLLITQADGNKIWSSPIWYNRNDAIVSSAPVASYTASTAKVCVNQPVLFLDKSTNAPTSWTWTASGASPSVSTIQNTNFTFPSSGSYVVSLTSANSSGSSVYTNTILVLSPLSTPTITANGTQLISTPSTSYQWYVNGSALSGITTQTCEPPFSGAFNVVATDPNFCNSPPSNSINVIVATAIIDYNNAHDLKIFPNPNKGDFTIEFNSIELETIISIYNYLGDLVYTKTVSSCPKSCEEKIDLIGYPNGIYSVKVSDLSKTSTYKLILNK